MSNYRPFLVADRPASLRMIRGADLEVFENSVGIMTHANVSSNVKSFIREFPSSAGFYDDETDDPRREREFVDPKTGELTERGKKIRNRTVRMCDSGAFLKEGSKFDDYADLYENYEEMDVDYGIILDELNDPEGTKESANDAISIYESGDYSFNLVGVTQGTTPQEYLDCYKALRDMGYEHIAVGGLLYKEGERTGAFAHVDDEEFLYTVLGRLREEYPDDWLFALGCHHPKRHSRFSELGLFGSDYKGWIYKYDKLDSDDTIAARRHRYEQIRRFMQNNILTNSFSIGNKRLLFLSCSERKRNTEERMPAIDRYDGAYYRTVKKWLRNNSDENLDILILSAKHGVIPPHYQIDDYDEVLSSNPDDEFVKQAYLNVEDFLRYRSYSEVFVAAGQNYRQVILPALKEVLNEDVPIWHAKGKIGTQLNQIKRWLGGEEGVGNPVTDSPSDLSYYSEP